MIGILIAAALSSPLTDDAIDSRKRQLEDAYESLSLQAERLSFERRLVEEDKDFLDKLKGMSPQERQAACAAHDGEEARRREEFLKQQEEKRKLFNTEDGRRRRRRNIPQERQDAGSPDETGTEEG